MEILMIGGLLSMACFGAVISMTLAAIEKTLGKILNELQESNNGD